MRAKYYMLSLRQMKKEKFFAFFLILLVMFSSITTLYIQVIEPILKEFVSSNAYTLAMKSTEYAIRENIASIQYDSIVSMVTDENGNLVALKANTNELNRIASNLAIAIEDNISEYTESQIKIPLGLFFNAGIFGGAGIKVKIKTVPLGDTKIECISEFDSVGINQTRHRIILNVKTYFTIIAPIYLKNECYEREIVLAETVINGDIPQTYYSLDLTKESELLNLT